MNILAALYYLVSFFYLFSALALLFFPEKMRRLLRTLFPLLESFHFPLVTNVVCLTVDGIALYLVGSELAAYSLWGWYFAFIFSALEVFLAFGFYLPNRKYWNAVVHFVVHIFLVIVIANIIVYGYSLQLNNIQTQVIKTIESSI